MQVFPLCTHVRKKSSSRNVADNYFNDWEDTAISLGTSPTQGHTLPCHYSVVHMEYQLCMETLLQMPRLTHLILLTQGRAPRQVPPHSKVKKRSLQRYFKRFKPTLGTAQGYPKAHLWFASTGCRHFDAKRPFVMVWLRLLRKTPLLSQTNRRQGRASPVQPWAEGKNCTTQKQAGEQQDMLLYPDASSVFREESQLPEKIDILNVH